MRKYAMSDNVLRSEQIMLWAVLFTLIFYLVFISMSIVKMVESLHQYNKLNKVKQNKGLDGGHCENSVTVRE